MVKKEIIESRQFFELGTDCPYIDDSVQRYHEDLNSALLARQKVRALNYGCKIWLTVKTEKRYVIMEADAEP